MEGTKEEKRAKLHKHMTMKGKLALA